MSVTNSIIPIFQFQGENDFFKYLSQLKSVNLPNENYFEQEARNPTLNEIIESIKNTGFHIVSNSNSLDILNTKDGTHKNIQSFEIKSNVNEYTENITVKYQNENNIEDIYGLKTGYKTLLKIAVELSKFSGSMFILNENEVIFVKKGKQYEEIIKAVNNVYI